MIPLSIPHLGGNEWKYVKSCLDTGWISSAGKFVDEFGESVASFTGSKHGVACVNGTSGLHLALELAGTKRDDLVIVPNITFIASLNAISYTGAQPLLFDICPDTWQMDLNLLEDFLASEVDVIDNQCIHKSTLKRISAIMPVHVLGNMVDMDRLLKLSEVYHLTIIEDATEALGSRYKGQHAGTFGLMGVYSFNGNKIISTGGGGVMVTNDQALAHQFKHLSTQAKVSPDEYIHDQIGYNYRLVNVLAAIGVAQMEQLSDFIQKKKLIDRYYRNELAGVGDISFQKVENEVDHNCWLFTLRTSKMRSLLKHLNNNGVQSRPFWQPMNQLPMFSDCLYAQKDNVSNQVYQEAISIPSSIGLSECQLEEVVETIKSFFKTE